MIFKKLFLRNRWLDLEIKPLLGERKIIVTKENHFLLHSDDDSIEFLCSPSIQGIQTSKFWNEEINVNVLPVMRKRWLVSVIKESIFPVLFLWGGTRISMTHSVGVPPQSLIVFRDEKMASQIGGFEEEKGGSDYSYFSLFMCCLFTRILTPKNLLWLVVFCSACSFRQQVL